MFLVVWALCFWMRWWVWTGERRGYCLPQSLCFLSFLAMSLLRQDGYLKAADSAHWDCSGVIPASWPRVSHGVPPLHSHMLCPGYCSVAVHIRVPFPDFARDWQPNRGVFIHGHVVPESWCWRGRWRTCGPPPKGTWLYTQWESSLASLWAGAEVFCEVSSRSLFAQVPLPVI